MGAANVAGIIDMPIPPQMRVPLGAASVGGISIHHCLVWVPLGAAAGVSIRLASGVHMSQWVLRLLQVSQFSIVVRGSQWVPHL
jgi:hypothetical protein